MFVYLFAWETPVLGGRLRVCHTLEIPFVFNTSRTRRSPATIRAPAARRDHGARLDRLRQDRQSGLAGLRPHDRPTMVFDLQSRVENDPFGAERRVWEEKR